MEQLTVKQVIQTERKCVASQCDRDCAKCDLVMDEKDILSAYDYVLELLDAEERGLLVRLPCKESSTQETKKEIIKAVQRTIDNWPKWKKETYEAYYATPSTSKR